MVWLGVFRYAKEIARVRVARDIETSETVVDAWISAWYSMCAAGLLAISEHSKRALRVTTECCVG
jgi:hypothetical protein